MRKLDNQMPQYAEDTSGARDASQYMQPAQQLPQQQQGGAKGTGGMIQRGISQPQSTTKGAQ